MISRNNTEREAFQRVKLQYPDAKNDHRKVMMPILKHLLYWTENKLRQNQIAKMPDFWNMHEAKKIGGLSFCQSLLLRISEGMASMINKDNLVSWRDFQHNNDLNILSDGYFFVNDVLSEDFEMHIIEIENTSPVSERRKLAYTNAMDCADVLGDVDVYFHLFDKSGVRERIYKTTPTHSMICLISGQNLFDCQFDSLSESEKNLASIMGSCP